MKLPPEPDRWTIDLANAQRVEAIAAFAFTERSTDKRRHFMRYLQDRLDSREYPHLLFGDGPSKAVRFFPDKLSIGMQPQALLVVTSPASGEDQR